MEKGNGEIPMHLFCIDIYYRTLDASCKYFLYFSVNKSFHVTILRIDKLKFVFGTENYYGILFRLRAITTPDNNIRLILILLTHE